MNTSDQADGASVEGSPERPDGGERVDEAVGNSLARQLRSAGVRSNPVADQHVPDLDADEDVPAIVTWHETLSQGL